MAEETVESLLARAKELAEQEGKTLSIKIKQDIKGGTLCVFWDDNMDDYHIAEYREYDEDEEDYPHISSVNGKGDGYTNAEPLPERIASDITFFVSKLRQKHN